MRTICYYPELVQMTGSINATLMMGQLEFWFKVTGGKPFYKFLEPCSHELYKVGDSWSEELGMTSSEIRSAFKHIGTMYKSKSAFLEGMERQDVFKGKPYAAYYDRIRKTTYYIRNDEKVREMFPPDMTQRCDKRDSSDCASGGGSDWEDVMNRATSGDGSAQQDMQLRKEEVVTANKLASVTEESASGLYREDYRINNIENSIKESLRKGNQDKQNDQHNQQHRVSGSSVIPYTEIVCLYNDNLGEELGYMRHLTEKDKRCIQKLWSQLNMGLEDFRRAFMKVAASRFLCGKVEGKKWRASFNWLLTKDHLTKVLEGFYDDFIVPIARPLRATALDKVRTFNQMESHYFDFEEIERLERLYIDKKLEAL